MNRKISIARLSMDSILILTGFVLICSVFTFTVWLTNWNTQRLATANGEVDRTYRVINGLERLFSTMKDA